MKKKNDSRKILLLLLSFVLMASWVTGVNPSRVSAASGSSLTSMNQPVETLIGGTEAIFRDGSGAVADYADDRDADVIDLPFPFNFFGDIYNKIYVSSNGSLRFDSPNSTKIAPFDDDLYVTTKSKVLYTTIGDGHNRKFVIQYTNMMTYSQRNSSTPFGTFQVILNESDNSIQFQYPNLVGLTHGEEAFGSDAWIGISGPSVSIEYSEYEQSLAEKQAIRFTPDGSNGYTQTTNRAGIEAYAAYDANVVYEPILLIPDLYPGTPVPVSPADGSFVSSNITFQWSAVNGATSYRLLIAEDAEFIHAVKDQDGIQQHSFDVNGLEEGQPYYWKIAAENNNGYTFSNSYRFVVPSDDSPKPVNQPVETLDNGTEVANFYESDDWGDYVSDGIPIGFGPNSKFKYFGTEYDEIYATTGGELLFGDRDYPEGGISPHYGPILSSASKVIYKTVGAEPYRKFVIQFTNMTINDAPVGTYQVIFYETTNVVQFQYPHLIALGAGDRAFGSSAWIGMWTDDDEVAYSSSKKSLAEKQAIRFTPDGSGSYELIKQANAQYEPILLIPNSFPSPSTFVSPADGSGTSTQVTLQWSNSSNPASYFLLIAEDAEFKSVLELDTEGLTDTSYSVSGLEEGKKYYWKVIAFNNGNQYTFSNTYRFITASSSSSTVTVDTGNISSVTTMTATAGGNVTSTGNGTIEERGIVYSLNANPTYSDVKVKAGTAGIGAYTVNLTGLQSNSTYHVRAYAISEGRITYGQEVAFTTLGSKVSLSSLSLSGVTLSESVSGSVYAYTASVPYSVSSTTIKATVLEAEYGSLTANVYNSANTLVTGPINLASGVTSSAIPLNVGINKVEIVVIAVDGSGTTYTVTVNRASAPSSSSGGGGGGGASPVTSKNGKITIPAGRAGEVSLDGDIEISVPANASSKQLELTIEKVLNAQGLLGNKEITASAIYEVLKNFPENFGKPVTLTLKFDATKIKHGQTVAIFYYDEAKKTWVKVEGGKIKGDRISADVNHFTKFAVLVVDEKTGLPVADQSTSTETTEPTAEVKLSDISGHWAEANIKEAVKQGIVIGYTDGTFKPNATVTRAEFAVMLNNALKPTGQAAELSFADKAKIGAWAREAIAQAVQANIIKGFTDGTFRPNAELSRAEMAAIVAGALKLTAEANTATSFVDDKLIPSWAKGAIGALTKLEVMQGKGGNKFDPNATTTRAEAVTVLLKMLAQESK
ncbi:S-layer homology domain-containing protein [Cohnella mopanensis]|uniref:S-layer homology domain-containing protein n=1 Tax=Cohnella mopanensis TaxID=2911966 RepID=UPI001EF95302|nr:S-layer homology domain-containing protein [Cohnella mopanensis]